jgi:hypothetical protein
MRRWSVIGLFVLVIAATGCVMLKTCWARFSVHPGSWSGDQVPVSMSFDSWSA